LLAGDPRAAEAPREHWTLPLALGVEGPTELDGTRVRRFDEDASVEGLALVGDEIRYAHDDEADQARARAPRRRGRDERGDRARRAVSGSGPR